MLDTLTFMLTLVITTGLLAGATGLILVTFVFHSVPAAQRMRAPLINSAVAGANTANDLAVAGPLAVFSYSMTNIAATILLLAAVALYIEVDGHEDRLMASVAPVYLNVNAVWMNAFIEPFIGLLAVAYGAVVPAANVLVMIVRELLYATIKVLGSSAQNPFGVFKAFLAIPKATGQIANAFVLLFDTTKGGNWMVNTFDMQPAIATLQTKLVGVVALQTTFVCRALMPAVEVVADVLMSKYVRGLIDSTVNTVLRAVQTWARVSVPQYHTFDARPLFVELRAFAVMGGGVLDDILQAALHLGALPVDTVGSSMDLPRPSVGTGIGRGLAAIFSLVEVPLNIITAVIEGKPTYEASSAAHAIKQAHLATTILVAGLDTVKTLVYTGHMGKHTRLDCNYYGYNFFADANIKGTIPTECICQNGECGNGICGDEGACECSEGYHPAIPGARAAKCIKTCHRAEQDWRAGATGTVLELAEGSAIAKCGPPLAGGYSAGQCMPSGYCRCTDEGAIINLATGKCQNTTGVLEADQRADSDQMPKKEWGTGRCEGVTTHTIGPVAECAVQSIMLGGIGAVYTGYEFLRELIFRFPIGFSEFDKMLQTFDGMWYPRMDSVSCSYRRDHSGGYDRTILPSNCMCEEAAYNDTELTRYDPYCARPTLNANVYSHMDAFAFYAGRKLPIQGVKHLKFIFVGGTGAQFGFLSDTLGVYVTTAARASVETVRIITHILAGLLTYVLSVGTLVAQAGSAGHTNMLQLPTNCEWGIPFDGPVPPRYTADNWDDAMRHYEALKDSCRNPEVCGSALEDRLAVIGAMMPTADGEISRTQAAELLNRVHTAVTIHTRNNVPSLKNCAKRAYDSRYLKCETTNADSDCICNPALQIEEGMACRAMAMYPFIEATSQDMQAYFKSDYLARYYSQHIPWAYSMLLEHKYFYELSASVAIQNIFARMASSSPLADEIDSQCYKSGSTYQLSTTSALTRLFQPNPSSTGFVFVGGEGGSVKNTTICQTLKKMDEIRWIKDNSHGGVDFASPGACLNPANDQTGCVEGVRPLRLLALRDFENPYVKQEMICYQVPTVAPVGIMAAGGADAGWGKVDALTRDRDFLLYHTPVKRIRSVIDTYFKGSYPKFCAVAMAGGFTEDHGMGDLAKANMAWVDIPAYRAKLVGYRLETDNLKLHPKTCGFMTQNDQLVFQPCRYKCHTEGGYDTCWCNVTVHHDVRCNAGDYYRKSAWKGIDMDRQMSTSVISMLAMIPEGIRKDNVGLMCERFRAQGSQVAIMASMLTMNSDGTIADELRERVGRLFFAFWEVFQLQSTAVKGPPSVSFGKIGEYSEMPLPKLGAFHMNGMAMQSVVYDMLRSLFPANLNAKACQFGDNACMKCSKEEQCQTKGSAGYCYAAGECPQDPFTADAKPGFCCSNDCEKTRQCPTSHACSTANGTNWCRQGERDALPDARACGEHPRTDKWENKCYVVNDHGTVRCVENSGCRRYKCMPSALACNGVVTSLGKVLATYLFKDAMFKAVDICTALDALQKLVYSTSISGDGADIIPTMQDFINSIFEVLDRSFANLMILTAQVVAGFLGVVTHPGDLRAWGSWIKAALHLMFQIRFTVITHAIDLTIMAMDAIPAPIGPILSELVGGVCYAMHMAFGHTFKLLKKVPGLGSIVPDHDWLTPHPSDKCMSRLTSEKDSPIMQADHARRRLHGRPLDEAGMNETEYHHWKEVVDWTGDTTCARIGRHAEPPDSRVGYEIWYTCLVNRQKVAVMRALIHNTLPWTLMDDWTQPIKYTGKFMHGIVVYLTQGEGVLRKWDLLGYPTQASMDAVQYLDGWALPKAPLQMVLDVIPHKYPDYLTNKEGIGHNLYAVVASMNDAKLPSLRGHNWGALHANAHSALLQIAGGVTLPSGAVRGDKPQPTRARRRLAAAVPANGPPLWKKEVDVCAEGGKGCMDCAVLTEAVDNVLGAVTAAGDYYTGDYPKVVEDFLDTVAHWESTNQDEDVAIFPDVSIAYRPMPTQPQQPNARVRLAYAEDIGDVQWASIARQFVTITDDTHIDIVEHSLWWYLKYPLRPCKSMQMVYDACTAPKYNTADAAALTGRTMAVLWTIGWIVNYQLPFLLQVPLASMLFMLYRYDYVPRCMPLLPVCLIRDVQYMVTQLTPQCICQLVPELVVNREMCTDELCAKATIIYRACPARALGMLWAPAFLLRWHMPSVFDYISAYMEGQPAIAGMRHDMENGVPLSPLDTTCASLGLVGALAVVLLMRLIFVFMAGAVRPLMAILTASMGSIALVMPFLLVTVPAIMKERVENPGILLRGWE